MSDKLIRYESLALLINAMNAQAALGTQQTAASTTATTNAVAATAAALSQTTTTIARTADAVQATYNAQTATTNAAAATAATQAATTLTQAATASAQAATGSATTQAAYAKQQGDYAKAQANNLGNMSTGVYDVNGNGVVDNAEQLGGVPPAGYVRSAGGSQDRVMSTSSAATYPTQLSTPQGYGRFRLGVTGESTGNTADVIDLSTGNNAGAGGVNSLYFDKGSARVTHKYGGFGASNWSSVRQLAYLDEVLPLTGGTLTGSLTATDFLKSSRRSLKQGIAPYAEDALAEVGKLEIVTYTYRKDVLGKAQVGIIADDTANPLISGAYHDSFDTANALAIALKAIQQLKGRVEELEARAR